MHSSAANIEVNKSIKKGKLELCECEQPNIYIAGNVFYCMNCLKRFIPKEATVEEQRKNSRKTLDQLTVGERFMLMFGRGELKHNPLRVEWKQ